MPTILATDAKHRKAILRWLIAKGYRWHDNSDYTPDEIENRWSYNAYPVIQVRSEDKNICGNVKDIYITHKSITSLSNDLDNPNGREVVKNSG